MGGVKSERIASPARGGIRWRERGRRFLRRAGVARTALGIDVGRRFPHGLRRGLNDIAAPRLEMYSLPLKSTGTGLKPGSGRADFALPILLRRNKFAGRCGRALNGEPVPRSATVCGLPAGASEILTLLVLARAAWVLAWIPG